MLCLHLQVMMLAFHVVWCSRSLETLQLLQQELVLVAASAK